MNNIKTMRKERGLTLDALAKLVGTSKQTVQRYESGVISNIPQDRIVALAQALDVAPAAMMGWESEDTAQREVIAFKQLPMLGEIACGMPILASEEHGEFVVTGIGMDADFCLRAHGDSMIGARIYDGDIVFIHAQDTVENGEIAAVIINDEATLKRVYFYPNEGKLVLSPENPAYPPLVFIGDELNDIKVIGKAVYFQSVAR